MYRMENTEETGSESPDEETISEEGTTHGEAVVTALLQTELTKLDLTGCKAHDYNTMTDGRSGLCLQEQTEGRYRKAVKQQENIKQSQDRVSREIESVQEQLHDLKQSTEMSTRDVTCSGSQKHGGSRKFQPPLLRENDAIQIIERVEKDSLSLTKTLKLFNRKHKTLPSIIPD